MAAPRNAPQPLSPLAPYSFLMPVVDLRVAMSCGGCEAAVRRVLEGTAGVEKVVVDLAYQKVSVTTAALTPEQVLAAARGSGKEAALW